MVSGTLLRRIFAVDWTDEAVCHSSGCGNRWGGIVRVPIIRVGLVPIVGGLGAHGCSSIEVRVSVGPSDESESGKLRVFLPI